MSKPATSSAFFEKTRSSPFCKTDDDAVITPENITIIWIAFRLHSGNASMICGSAADTPLVHI